MVSAEVRMTDTAVPRATVARRVRAMGRRSGRVGRRGGGAAWTCWATEGVADAVAGGVRRVAIASRYEVQKRSGVEEDKSGMTRRGHVTSAAPAVLVQ